MLENNRFSVGKGSSLGRYQLLRRIGRGGMGDVWLADDPRLRRQVAIKTLPVQNQRDKQFIARFEHEAQSVAMLNHPHILTIHDYGKQSLPDGRVIAYIVMPFIAGGSLEEHMQKLAENASGLPQQVALTYLTHMAEAIDYAHQQGVIHRDIKPANMLLRTDDWLLLTDFGIARILSDKDHFTRTGNWLGTPEYMAPEQAQGKAVYASDDYSLAVLAYRIFTGRFPFTADTGQAIVIQHLTIPPVAPRQINPYLSPSFEATLLRGLAKNPAERFPTASIFVEELRRHSTNQFLAVPQSKQPLAPTEGAPRPVTETREVEDLTTQRNTIPPSSQAPHLSRRTILLSGAAALIAVGAGGGIWTLTHHRDQSTPTASQTQVATRIAQAPTDPNAPVLILREHNHPATSLTWSPQTTMLASADNHQVKLWNIQQYQLHQSAHSTTSHDFETGLNMTLAWSPDGELLAIGDSGEAPLDPTFSSTSISVYKGDLSGRATGYEQPIILKNTVSIQGLGWVYHSYIVAASEVAPFSMFDGFLLRLWDTAHPQLTLKPIQVAGSQMTSGLNTNSNLAISPDGTQIAVPLISNAVIGQVKIAGDTPQWQQQGEYLKFPSDVIEKQVGAVTWSPDGNVVAAISAEITPSTLMVWNIKDRAQKPISLSLPGSDTNLTTLAWSHSFLAAGSKDSSVYLWDTTKNTLPTRTLTSGGLKAKVISLAWSRDGQWLAAGYDDVDASILVWKV